MGGEGKEKHQHTSVKRLIGLNSFGVGARTAIVELAERDGVGVRKQTDGESRWESVKGLREKHFLSEQKLVARFRKHGSYRNGRGSLHEWSSRRGSTLLASVQPSY